MNAAGVQPEVVLMRDCLGGERVVEVDLSVALSREALARLEDRGSLWVLEGLPRPFARLDVPGEFLLTGILGERRVRFTMRLAMRDNARDTALAMARVLGDE